MDPFMDDQIPCDGLDVAWLVVDDDVDVLLLDDDNEDELDV